MADEGLKITDAVPKLTLDGTEELPANNSGSDVKITTQSIVDLVSAGESQLDKIVFNPNPPVITTANTIYWNNKEYTVDVITGLGTAIQVGQEQLVLIYNNTGGIIYNFKVLYPISSITIGGIYVPTVGLADASNHEKCQGPLFVATHEIADGALGFATISGKARNGDTSIWGSGKRLWLTADGSGDMTITKPSFPDYAISIGGTLNNSATEGEIYISFTKTIEDTFNDAWDGAIRETFNFTVDSSDGINVIGTLSNVSSSYNLTLILSDGLYTLDTTTTPLTINLTPGTDSSTITNYVYIPLSTKLLTVSTSGFPTTEHCKIAQLEVQSALTVQAESGARRNQNINDHIKYTNNNGHILHIADRIRQLNAQHDNGTEATLTGVTTNVYIQVTGGQVWQLHKQDFPSFSMPTNSILVKNDFTTPYRKTDNLNTINAYSTGLMWNNEWSKIVIWGVINRTGEPSFVFCNLPSAGYNSEESAISDADGYADYTIPKKYNGVGFLIAAFTIRVSGAVFTYNGGTAYQDLRGFIPNNIAGGVGGGSGVTTLLALTDVFISSYATKKGQSVVINDLETGIVSENKGWLYNVARTFKLINNVESISADRIATWPDKSITVAGTDDITHKVKITLNDTTEDYLDAKFTVGNEFAKTINNPSANENILLTFKGWIYNVGRTFYTSLVSAATAANYTATLPAKSGTVAFLDDITGARTITQTPIALADAGTTDIVVADDVKRYSIADGVTSHTFTVSGLSDMEEKTAKRIIDNSANASAVTLTWSDSNGDWTWDDSVALTGPSSFAAGGIYVLEIEVESATIVFALLTPKAV